MAPVTKTKIPTQTKQKKATPTVCRKPTYQKAKTCVDLNLLKKLKSPPYFRDEITLEQEIFKNHRLEFEEEVKAFKRTLRELELELSRPRSLNVCDSNSNTAIQKDNTRMDSKLLPEKLKKSFSVNDINYINKMQKITKIKNGEQTFNTAPPPHTPTKADSIVSNAVEDEKLIEASDDNENISTKNEIPTIKIESPISTSSVSTKISSKTSICKTENSNVKDATNDKPKVPVSFFKFNVTKKKETRCVTSPMFPVARPNLAATLRAEVCRRRIREMNKNAAHQEKLPTSDWEVRKTPAWKSLSYNESHKRILRMRLATRKAEQELQQRLYEENLEMMKRRVKTAPLLLEGQTHWGPNVGKLTHTCRAEGNSQTQQNLLTKNVKNKVANNNICAYNIRPASRVMEVRKIYGGNENYQRRAIKQLAKPKVCRSPYVERSNGIQEYNYSEDDLSSVDRAFL